jgi:MTH538 TIR-like domain (DUF1863)
VRAWVPLQRGERSRPASSAVLVEEAEGRASPTSSTAGYAAFISYSHAADGRLAPAVQRGLEQLAKPWYRRRALRVFRDDSGLAVTPALWSTIVTALDESQYLVLLLSPEAARSAWVAREIEHWKTTKPIERILPVITDGQLHWDSTRGGFDPDRSTALPPSLLGSLPKSQGTWISAGRGLRASLIFATAGSETQLPSLPRPSTTWPRMSSNLRTSSCTSGRCAWQDRPSPRSSRC